jgi:WD40 repeat protein
MQMLRKRQPMKPNNPSNKAWHLYALLAAWVIAAGCSALPITKTPLSPPPDLAAKATLTPSPPLPSPSVPPPTAPLVPTALPPTPSPSSAPSPWLAELSFGAWDQVLAAAWSSDGKLLAASAGEKVYIFEAPFTTFSQVLSVNSGTERLAFSPEQNPDVPYLLAAAAKDGTAQLWNASTGQKLVAWQAHQKGARSVAFSPTGGILATTGGDAMVRLWELPGLAADLPETPVLQAEMIGGAYSIPDAKFSPDGRLVASVDIHDIRLRDPATQRLARTLRGETSIFRLAFSPDGSQLATAEMGNRLSLWETTSGISLGVWFASAEQAGDEKVFLWDLVFSPDGKWLAAGGSDGMVTLWDVPAGQVSTRFSAHAQAVTSLAFSPDGKQLASGGLDSVVRIWNVDDLP